MTFLPQTDHLEQAGPNISVNRAWQVINRAHSAAVKSLDTSFQRTFSRVARVYSCVTDSSTSTGALVQDCNMGLQADLYYNL
ncbi:hypothetical protein BDW59DRAFT_148927 [Aspergillus cavernicola]|uniref:Uncharacterized protein n=1 Tax=Aspergillus cavernicola TaxID=176166 RepID=A0ABR4I693_9EURO